MVTSQATVENTTIEIDTAELEKRLMANLSGESKRMVEAYLKECKDSDKFKENFKPEGKGVVEAYLPEDRKTKIVEAFKNAGASGKIQEQWTIALPKQRYYEQAAHMRDFVYVTDVLKGNPGDTVNIPYVKDTEFEFVTVGTGSFTVKTGLVNTMTASLVECGAYYDCYYSDIEKIDSNLLDELNSVFSHASIRAEDEKLLNLLDNGTTSAFGETIAGGDGAELSAGELNFAAASTMAVSWIADALVNLMRRGKDVHPGECILYLPNAMYITLLKKLSATTNTAVAYAMPTIWTKGMVESYLGIKIVTGGYQTRSTNGSGIGGQGTSYQCGYLMRPKRALALAPKREILIETDKQIAARTLRIVASHTFGSAILDQTEVVRIWSGITGTATTGLGCD